MHDLVIVSVYIVEVEVYYYSSNTYSSSIH